MLTPTRLILLHYTAAACHLQVSWWKADTFPNKLDIVTSKRTSTTFYCLSMISQSEICPPKNTATRWLIFFCATRKTASATTASQPFLRFDTVPDRRQFRTASVWLGQIPPFSRLLALRNALCTISTYCSAPCITMTIADVLVLSIKSRFTLWSGIPLAWIRRSSFGSCVKSINPDVESSPKDRDNILQIVAEEGAQVRGKQLQQATQRAVKNALSDIFLTGYTEAEQGLKKASYRFIEALLTNIPGKRTLGEVFDCSIEWRTQFTMFIDAMSARALSSDHFTWLVINFMLARMDKTAAEGRLTAKAEGFQQPSNFRT